MVPAPGRTVDVEVRRAPAVRTIRAEGKGPGNERRIRTEFERLARWASSRKLRTGRWFFIEPAERRWGVAIEVRGPVRGEAAVRVRNLPASRVASVRYDPDLASPRVIYHGLTDGLRWRKKDGSIRRAGVDREVYEEHPWTRAKARSRSEIQVLVRGPPPSGGSGAARVRSDPGGEGVREFSRAGRAAP